MQRGSPQCIVQVRPVDADAIVRIQMPPPPLPISWGRTVQPFVPQHSDSQRQAAQAAEAGGAFDRTYQACRQLPCSCISMCPGPWLFNF